MIAALNSVHCTAFVLRPIGVRCKELMTNDFSGRGDPLKTLRLLWGAAPAPTRGPKPKLAIAEIVAERGLERVGGEAANPASSDALNLEEVLLGCSFVSSSCTRQP